jgi:hypothetical protein
MNKQATKKDETIAEVVEEARQYDRELEKMEREDRKDGLKGSVILAGIIALVLGLYFLVHYFIS